MNFQNLPRKEKIVKRAIVPKLDYLLFADYDQIEMRVLAYYMAQLGDRSMADVLSDESRDLHAESAKGIFMLEREPLDYERQLGKNMNFSMVYGGGRPAVLRYLGEFNEASDTKLPVTWGYASKVLDNFHRRWPGLQYVMDTIHNVYNERGFLRTIAKARLHPRSKHAELNLVVQSSAAECMRRALRYSARNLKDWKSHLVCVVHDELIFDVVEDELSYIASNINDWMDFPELSEIIPIRVSLEISNTTWADKVPLEV